MAFSRIGRALLPALAAALLVVPLAGCVRAPGRVVPAPDASATAGAVAHDLAGLLATIKRAHPDPWHGVDEATFTAALSELSQRSPALGPDQRLVEVMRLMALLGRAGREGHTGVIPWTADAPGTHVYPIQLWHFPDGLHVVAARAPHQDLVGGRVLRLAGHPITDVTRAVRPLTPHENEQSHLSFGPMLHLQPEILHGVGLLAEAGPASIELRHPDGRTTTRTLQPISTADYRAWLMRSAVMLPPAGTPVPEHLLGHGEPLTLRWMDATRTAYLRYREVRGDTSRVAAQLTEWMATRDVARVVVDLRWNPGGNNLTYPPLLDALLAPGVDRPGRLFVLTSRITFSAATNFATELDLRSSAVFVGEATGGSPNLYGDTTNYRMASLGLTVRVPTIYWEKSTPDDTRLAIEPDLPVPLTAADYFAGRDPVLEAVLAT